MTSRQSILSGFAAAAVRKKNVVNVRRLRRDGRAAGGRVTERRGEINIIPSSYNFCHVFSLYIMRARFL